MEVVQKLTLPGPVNAIAVEPDGDRVAVAVADRSLLIYRASRGVLSPAAEWPIGPDRYRMPADRAVTLAHTRVAFHGPSAILIARVLNRTTSDRSIPTSELFRTLLLEMDPATGGVRGEYDRPGGLIMWSGPLPLEPGLALVDLVQTVACVDTASFEELCRVRELDEFGDPVGDDVDPDETLTWNGIAYQASEGQIYILWRVFGEVILERHRLDREGRGFILEGREPVIRDYQAHGVCANLDGDGVTAWFTIPERSIDLPGSGDAGASMATQLGRIVVVSRAGKRSIDVDSQFPRDFLAQTLLGDGTEGQPERPRARVAVEEDYAANLVYVGDHDLLLNTPSGLLLRVDTLGGGSAVAHDCGSRVNGLGFLRAHRLLIAGCEDGTLDVLSP